ncbi:MULTISPECIES: YHYH protein [unclassified Vibrio]|uniref:YHYH protein n=1 Tax=unclassified Vibrio TaxID=2614977 RepID=UPI000ADCE8F7|nr:MULTISPECIES: YHYH protein [unclassified Vibrio]
MKRILIIGTVLGLLQACNSSSDNDDTTSEESDVPSNATDITDVRLTNQSGHCEDYVGQYVSSVNDIQRNLLFAGDVTITSNGSECSLKANAIPNHDFNDQSASFATDVAEQSKEYLFDIFPSKADTPSALSLVMSEAVMLNGVKIDLLAAACYNVADERVGCGEDQIDNPWRYDPMSSLNQFGTDEHHAHVQPTGEYHYHGNPMALFYQSCEGGEASPVIGFAADGFPIYGRCFADATTGEIRAALSSYQLKSGNRVDSNGYSAPIGGAGLVVSDRYDGQFRGDYEYSAGQGDLDECNGMTVDGQYGYYVTDSFPWVLNCFAGTPNASFSGTNGSRSHSHL